MLWKPKLQLMTPYQKHIASVATWSPERRADKERRVKEAQKRYNEAHPERRKKQSLECWKRRKAAMTPEEIELERQRIAAYDKQYRADNAARRKAQKAAYYLTPAGKEKRRAASERLHRRRGMKPRSKLPPEVAQERARASWSKYQKTHGHVRRARYAQRIKDDLNYRLRKTLSSRIRNFVSGKDKSQSTMQLLGCTVEEFKAHIEKQFEPWMNWGNFGRKGWSFDHIQACSLFDLSQPEQQAQCFRFSNIRPMHHIHNIRKGNKLPPGVPHPNPPCQQAADEPSVPLCQSTT